MEDKPGRGPTVWTPSQSTFVHTYLANIVAEGVKTSTGFKKVHLNSCAKALNEHFKISRTGDHIANHLKTLRKKYVRINKLRNLTAALWDEDQFIISLDHEHYTSHMEEPKNKGDDEYLNKPLPYYGDLATIFGNSVATGQFAKSSNDPLAVDAEGNEESPEYSVNEAGSKEGTGTTSAASRPGKKAKTVASDSDALVGAFQQGTETLADAIKEAAKGNADAIKEAAKVNSLPDGLFESVDSLPGFELEHKSVYYAHLVDHPAVAKAFVVLPFEYKLSWISKFVSEKCNF